MPRAGGQVVGFREQDCAVGFQFKVSMAKPPPLAVIKCTCPPRPTSACGRPVPGSFLVRSMAEQSGILSLCLGSIFYQLCKSHNLTLPRLRFLSPE